MQLRMQYRQYMQIGQDQRTALMQLQLTGEIENLFFLFFFFQCYLDREVASAKLFFSYALYKAYNYNSMHTHIHIAISTLNFVDGFS